MLSIILKEWWPPFEPGCCTHVSCGEYPERRGAGGEDGVLKLQNSSFKPQNSSSLIHSFVKMQFSSRAELHTILDSSFWNKWNNQEKFAPGPSRSCGWWRLGSRTFDYYTNHHFSIWNHRFSLGNHHFSTFLIISHHFSSFLIIYQATYPTTWLL